MYSSGRFWENHFFGFKTKNSAKKKVGKEWGEKGFNKKPISDFRIPGFGNFRISGISGSRDRRFSAFWAFLMLFSG